MRIFIRTRLAPVNQDCAIYCAKMAVRLAVAVGLMLLNATVQPGSSWGGSASSPMLQLRILVARSVDEIVTDVAGRPQRAQTIRPWRIKFRTRSRPHRAVRARSRLRPPQGPSHHTVTSNQPSRHASTVRSCGEAASNTRLVRSVCMADCCGFVLVLVKPSTRERRSRSKG
jgi:hypothetical protein